MAGKLPASFISQLAEMLASSQGVGKPNSTAEQITLNLALNTRARNHCESAPSGIISVCACCSAMVIRRETVEDETRISAHTAWNRLLCAAAPKLSYGELLKDFALLRSAGFRAGRCDIGFLTRGTEPEDYRIVMYGGAYLGFGLLPERRTAIHYGLHSRTLMRRDTLCSSYEWALLLREFFPLETQLIAKKHFEAPRSSESGTTVSAQDIQLAKAITDILTKPSNARRPKMSCTTPAFEGYLEELDRTLVAKSATLPRERSLLRPVSLPKIELSELVRMVGWARSLGMPVSVQQSCVEVRGFKTRFTEPGTNMPAKEVWNRPQVLDIAINWRYEDWQKAATTDHSFCLRIDYAATAESAVNILWALRPKYSVEDMLHMVSDSTTPQPLDTKAPNGEPALSVGFTQWSRVFQLKDGWAVPGHRVILREYTECSPAEWAAVFVRLNQSSPSKLSPATLTWVETTLARSAKSTEALPGSDFYLVETESGLDAVVGVDSDGVVISATDEDGRTPKFVVGKKFRALFVGSQLISPSTYCRYLDRWRQ